MLEERMMFFSPEVLDPVGHLAVYERMLANLLGVYQRERQTGSNAYPTIFPMLQPTHILPQKSCWAWRSS